MDLILISITVYWSCVALKVCLFLILEFRLTVLQVASAHCIQESMHLIAICWSCLYFILSYFSPMDQLVVHQLLLFLFQKCLFSFGFLHPLEVWRCFFHQTCLFVCLFVFTVTYRQYNILLTRSMFISFWAYEPTPSANVLFCISQI